MKPEDLQMLTELRRLLGRQADDGTAIKPSPVWLDLLFPELEQARNEAIARMADVTVPAAERGEYAHAYHLSKKLAALLPDRLAKLERDYEAFLAKRSK